MPTRRRAIRSTVPAPSPSVRRADRHESSRASTGPTRSGATSTRTASHRRRRRRAPLAGRSRRRRDLERRALGRDQQPLRAQRSSSTSMRPWVARRPHPSASCAASRTRTDCGSPEATSACWSPTPEHRTCTSSRPRGGWHGVAYPAATIAVMDDETFLVGHRSPEEGGPKGLDLDPRTNMLLVTSEETPLSCFDAGAIVERPWEMRRDDDAFVLYELQALAAAAEHMAGRPPNSPPQPTPPIGWPQSSRGSGRRRPGG